MNGSLGEGAATKQAPNTSGRSRRSRDVVASRGSLVVGRIYWPRDFPVFFFWIPL